MGGNLYTRRKELQDTLQEINKKIAANELADNIKKLNAYVGKYYEEVNDSDKEYHRCFYVYGVTKDGQNLEALEFSYWSNTEIYYHMSYNATLWLNRPSGDKVNEITREEFLFHKSEVDNRINNIKFF